MAQNDEGEGLVVPLIVRMVVSGVIIGLVSVIAWDRPALAG